MRKTAIWIIGAQGYSRSAMLLWAFLLFTFQAGVRASLLLLWETLVTTPGGRKVAILGADSSGEFMAKILRMYDGIDARPVVILDCDPGSRNLRIGRVPVCHAGDDPVGAIRRFEAELLILPPNASLTESQKRVAGVCIRAGFPVRQFNVTLDMPAEPLGTGLQSVLT